MWNIIEHSQIRLLPYKIYYFIIQKVSDCHESNTWINRSKSMRYFGFMILVSVLWY